jgi:hypothetical protein
MRRGKEDVVEDAVEVNRRRRKIGKRCSKENRKK